MRLDLSDEMTVAIIIVVILAVVYLALYFSPGERETRAKLTYLLEERPKRNDEDYCDAFFSGSKVTPEILSKIRAIFSEKFDLDLRGLEPDDDLSTDYSLLWAMDSLADVEIMVALEEAFQIEFENEEAATMRSLRAIAEVVAAKLDKQSKASPC